MGIQTQSLSTLRYEQSHRQIVFLEAGLMLVMFAYKLDQKNKGRESTSPEEAGKSYRSDNII